MKFHFNFCTNCFNRFQNYYNFPFFFFFLIISWTVPLDFKVLQYILNFVSMFGIFQFHFRVCVKYYFILKSLLGFRPQLSQI